MVTHAQRAPRLKRRLLKQAVVQSKAYTGGNIIGILVSGVVVGWQEAVTLGLVSYLAYIVGWVAKGEYDDYQYRTKHTFIFSVTGSSEGDGIGPSPTGRRLNNDGPTTPGNRLHR